MQLGIPGNSLGKRLVFVGMTPTKFEYIPNPVVEVPSAMTKEDAEFQLWGLDSVKEFIKHHTGRWLLGVELNSIQVYDHYIIVKLGETSHLKVYGDDIRGVI